MNRLLHTARLAALAALFALPAAAAEAPAPPAEPPGGQTAFGETIDVRVVNVEVVVTDKQGNRVTGLGPEDLILYVDGEDVPIDYFTEVRGGVALAPAAGAAALPGVPAAAAGRTVGTSYLVFVDDWFPIERDRNRVLQALAEDLPSLGPDDRMAVVAFDGGRVEMLTSWTGSRRELGRTLQAAMDRPAFGLQRVAAERAHETGFGLSRARSRDYDLTIDEYAFARDVEARIDRAVGAAVATLRGFAQPPGRKVMLLLSGGWPYSPAIYAVNDGPLPVLASDYGGGARIYEPLIDTANLLGYTLYPVDVPGLAGGFGADVERGGEPLVGGDPSPLGQSFERERQVHDTLYVLAQETGGRPLINAGRREALPLVAADVQSYYWIGFTPDRQRDDELHRIRVEAIGRGLEVRAREGFRDLSRETEGDLVVESALLFGGAPTAGGPGAGRLIAEAGTSERDGRRYMEVPVTLGIPLDGVTTLRENGDHVARLELRVAALDDRERMSEVPTVPFELRFPEAPEAGTAVAYETRLRLRNEPQDLVVSIHDPLTGAHLMTRLEVAAAR